MWSGRSSCANLWSSRLSSTPSTVFCATSPTGWRHCTNVRWHADLRAHAPWFDDDCRAARRDMSAAADGFATSPTVACLSVGGRRPPSIPLVQQQEGSVLDVTSIARRALFYTTPLSTVLAKNRDTTSVTDNTADESPPIFSSGRLTTSWLTDTAATQSCIINHTAPASLSDQSWQTGAGDSFYVTLITQNL